MKPNETIPLFDQYLKKHKLSFDAVVVGGTALAILGVIKRETQDCDILFPEIPSPIHKAAQDFAKTKGLETNWLNNGPESLKRDLPKGWMARLQDLYAGDALVLKTLGRNDLLATKLWAYCDRGFDLDDCIKLKPTREELLEAIKWVSHQDSNESWPDHVKGMFAELAKELGYEL
jgi:hypothetical protein